MSILNPNIENYLAKNIKDICGSDYHNDKTNHCAHFVSHVMGYSFGYTCKNETGKGTTGAAIRVHELFSRCPKVGLWKDKPAKDKTCLAFVTAASNVKLGTKTILNVKRKHVGIYKDGNIYHYSNTKDKVVKQTPDEFSTHYRGTNITVYFGTLPNAVTAVKKPA